MQPDPCTVADFVGSWHATAVVYTNNADAGQQLDVVTVGVTLDITVLTSGGVRTWLETPDSSDEWDALMTVSGSTLTLDPVEAGRPTRIHTFAFLSDDSFTATDTVSEFDFTLTGATTVAGDAGDHLRPRLASLFRLSGKTDGVRHRSVGIPADRASRR